MLNLSVALVPLQMVVSISSPLLKSLRTVIVISLELMLPHCPSVAIALKIVFSVRVYVLYLLPLVVNVAFVHSSPEVFFCHW